MKIKFFTPSDLKFKRKHKDMVLYDKFTEACRLLVKLGEFKTIAAAKMAIDRKIKRKLK